MKMDENQPNPAFTCPITNDIFTDPVIAEDGHTYERAAITDWLRRHLISPLSRLQIKVENLRPNLVIKQMMEEFDRFQRENQQIIDSNKEFQQKFSIEIDKVPQNDVQVKDLNKLKGHLNVAAFTCPLTKQVFEQPVLASDGYTYQKKAIENWLVKTDKSPKTNQKLNKNLLPNHATKSMIDLFKSQQKQWKSVKGTQKKFLCIFAPKVRQMLQNEVRNLNKKAAKQVLQHWQVQVNFDKEKQDLLKRQTQLNAYKLKDQKYTFQVPQSLSTFVGRQEELQMMDEIFLKKNIICLIGSGGMGKSQIATEYMSRSKYHSKIWLHGENKLLTFQIQTYLEKAHNIETKNIKSHDDLMRKFYESLGASSLVVIDNVENQEYIINFLPKNLDIKVIITSRYRSWNVPKIQLTEFSQEEAFKYIMDVLKDRQMDISLIETQKLNNLLGGMPLALSQAVASIKQDKQLSIERYCQLFKKTQSQSFDERNQEKFNNLYTTLILSLHHVSKVNDNLNLIMKAIGYMSPQQLDKHLALSFLESQDGKGFGKLKSKKIKKIFRVLCDYSIISQNQKNDNFYSINRLTQSAIRMVHINKGEFKNNFNKFADWIHQSLFYDQRDLDDVARVTMFIPHGLALTSIENSNIYPQKDQLLRQIGYHQFYSIKNYLQAKTCLQQALKASQSQNSRDKDTLVRILSDLGSVNSELGNYDKQLEIHTRALQLSEKFLGRNSERTAQVLNNLGPAYGNLGDYQKEMDTLLRALQIKEKYLKLNKDDISISKTLIHLGTAYGNLGDYQKKKQVLTRALAISEKHFGKNHPNNNVINMNLANVNCKLGNNREPQQQLLQVLKKIDKKFGSQHPDYALAAMNLGVFYTEVGDYQQAVKYLKQSSEINYKLFGHDNPKTQLVLHNLKVVQMKKLAVVKVKANEKKQKQQFGNKASKIMSNQQGPSRLVAQKPSKGKQKSNSDGVILELMKNLMQKVPEDFGKEKASDKKYLEKQALSLLQNIFNGQDHKKKQSIIGFVFNQSQNFQGNSNKCELLIAAGRNLLAARKYNQAITKLSQARALNFQFRGDEYNKNMAIILNCLGTAYNQLDQFDKALEVLSQGLVISKQHFGENNHDTAAVLANLGSAYLGLGNPHLSKQNSEKAYKVMLKLHGPNNRATQDILFNIGLANQKLQKMNKSTIQNKGAIQQKNAIQNQTNLQKDNELYHNANMMITSAIYQKYGEGLIQMHGLQKMVDLDMYQFSFKDDQQSYGLYHLQTLKSSIELGLFYRSLGQLDKSVTSLKQSLQISEKIYGQKHPSTIEIKQNLSDINRKLKQSKNGIIRQL